MAQIYIIELSAGHLCRNSCIIEKAAGDRRQQSHSYMLFPSSSGVTDEYNIEMCFIYELPEHKNREQKMAAS
jgi:hypothetical protein